MPYELGEKQLQELLPDQWLKENPDKRWEIAETRKAERQAM
jgi:hypothetical protein